MMTETHINSSHMLSQNMQSLVIKGDMEKMDDVGWKAKLKIPPKDKRVKTSVSIYISIINWLID